MLDLTSDYAGMTDDDTDTDTDTDQLYNKCDMNVNMKFMQIAK
eukprot:gene10696-3317_t